MSDTGYHDLRHGRRPAPTEPGYVRVADVATQYETTTRGIQQRAVRAIRAGFPIRRRHGWLHAEDLRTALAAYNSGEGGRAGRPTKQSPPQYDRHAEAAALARHLALDGDPVLSVTAHQISEAGSVAEQRRLVAEMATGDSVALQCAADTLAQILRGDMPCRIAARNARITGEESDE